MHSVKRSRVSLQFNIIILIMRLADHAINLVVMIDQDSNGDAKTLWIVKLLTPDGPNLKDK